MKLRKNGMLLAVVQEFGADSTQLFVCKSSSVSRTALRGKVDLTNQAKLVSMALLNGSRAIYINIFYNTTNLVETLGD
eukprot:181152-Pyramimonas_sp.AAC.1